MQDNYAGDVGDFGKFGLLQYLLLEKKLANRLGVVWYFFDPGETASKDGRHVDFYKKDPALCNCNAPLAELLRTRVLPNRTVNAIQAAGIFPRGTEYFRDDVNVASRFHGTGPRIKEARLQAREEWVEAATQKVQSCDLVFLDPDNGLESPSCGSKNLKDAGKYVYLDEVRKFKSQAPVVVLYHHLHHSASHPDQITSVQKRLAAEIGSAGSVFGLRFWRYSPRAFFVICSRNLEASTRSALATFMTSQWKNHWDHFTQPD